MPAPSLPRDETSIQYEGWRVVAVCFGVATFAWALGFYGQGIYLAELQRLYGWPASLISTATTFFYLSSAVLVIFLSEAVRTFGPKACLAGGVICMAVAAAAMGWITQPWQLYLVSALMAVGWSGTSVAAISSTLGPWFDARRGMAISLALNGASFGGIVGVPLLAAAVGTVGFRAAQTIMAAVMLLALLPPILAWIGRPPARITGDAAADASTAPVLSYPGGAIRARALRTTSFWTLTVAFAAMMFAQVGFIVHQISFLEPSVGRDRASLMVSLMTAMAVVGRLSLGAVIDRIDQRKASSISFLSQALALMVMLWTTNELALFLATAVFGFTVGNAITLPTLIVQREYDAQAFGVVVGLVMAIMQFVYAFGPGAIGWLRDLSGSYALPLIVCIALEIAAAVILLIRRQDAQEFG